MLPQNIQVLGDQLVAGALFPVAAIGFIAAVVEGFHGGDVVEAALGAGDDKGGGKGRLFLDLQAVLAEHLIGRQHKGQVTDRQHPQVHRLGIVQGRTDHGPVGFDPAGKAIFFDRSGDLRGRAGCRLSGKGKICLAGDQ